MDLVRRQVGGGREPQAGVVEGLALRQPPHPTRVVRHGRRLGADLGQGRQHALIAPPPRPRQRRPPLGQQPFLRRRVGLQSADLALEIGPDRIVGFVVERGARDDRRRVHQRRLEHEHRRDHPSRGPRPQGGRDLAHHPFGLDQPRHISLGVGDAGDAVVVDHEHRQARGRIAVGRELIAPVPPAVGQPRLLHPVFEQPPRQPAVGAQGLRVELVVQLQQLPLGQSQPSRRRRVGGVVQLVVVGLQPQRGHLLRRQGDPLLKGLFEKRRQPRILALGGGGGRGVTGMAGVRVLC